MAGENAEAEARLKRALALLRVLDAPWQIGRTLAELGELAVVQTQTVVAREYFARAVTLFERVRATPDQLRVQTALAALA
jgi:hypothetical protein